MTDTRAVISCQRDRHQQRRIAEYAEALKSEAHKLGDHGLDEEGFYASGLLRGAIEQIRGEYSATMREKREFACEEVGELARAHNAWSLCPDPKGLTTPAQVDAVGDIVIVLAAFCDRLNINLEGIVERTWREVKNRSAERVRS